MSAVRSTSAGGLEIGKHGRPVGSNPITIPTPHKWEPQWLYKSSESLKKVLRKAHMRSIRSPASLPSLLCCQRLCSTFSFIYNRPTTVLPPKRAVAIPALWAPEESVRSANSCRNTPNDSVFHHISKKSKGLPETSFGAAPPSYSGVEPPRNAALKPPAVPFAHREPRKRPKQSRTFTPNSRPAQMQPGTLKDNVQQKWRGAIAVGRTGSAPSLAQSCVSDVSPMMRNEVGTTSALQFDKERVHVPSLYVPAPSSSPSVKGVQIGRQDNQNESQGWSVNAGLHSVRPQNTSSYPRPSKRVWPAPGMYTAQSEKDGDEECVGRSQGGYVPREENQRTGTCSFVQSKWEPTTACRTWQEEDTQTLRPAAQSEQPVLDASQSLFSLL